MMASKKNKDLKLTIKQSRLADVMEDIARFDNSYRTFDGKLVRAGQVVRLEANNKIARVVARGPAGLKKSEISLSSEVRDKLGVQSGQEVSFSVSKANWIDDFLWAWGATNAMPRIAARLGLVSVGLGFLGVLLGLYSLYLTLCQPGAGSAS